MLSIFKIKIYLVHPVQAKKNHCQPTMHHGMCWSGKATPDPSFKLREKDDAFVGRN